MTTSSFPNLELLSVTFPPHFLSNMYVLVMAFLFVELLTVWAPSCLVLELKVQVFSVINF